MYVGLKMLRDFATVAPDTLVKDADRIIHEKKLWMLLVVDGDRLVGYVRKEDIRGAMPSYITTLDKHEALYLLSKLTIKSILRKDITTISPDVDIETAAAVMSEKNLAGLAVINEKEELIGFINRSVMLEVLVEEMGQKLGGVRLVIAAQDRKGVINEVSSVIRDQDTNIISTGTYYFKDSRMLVVRIATDDATAIREELERRGYTIVEASDFETEWS